MDTGLLELFLLLLVLEDTMTFVIAIVILGELYQ